jgi:hypothetical protein
MATGPGTLKKSQFFQKWLFTALKPLKRKVSQKFNILFWYHLKA